MKFKITKKLLQRVGRERKKKPNSSSFRWYGWRVDVYHRECYDVFNIYRGDEFFTQFTHDECGDVIDGGKDKILNLIISNV